MRGKGGSEVVKEVTQECNVCSVSSCGILTPEASTK